MRQTAGVLALSLALGSAAAAAGQSASPSLKRLIEAERAFSSMSEARGVREAFLYYLADDSIVFRPGPVPGRRVYEDLPGSSTLLLTWTPEYAEVSAGGDLGFTTGPYLARDRTRTSAPAGHGHYVSVWERQANREWKVSFDAGVRHPEPGPAPAETASLPAGFKRWRGRRADRISERSMLLKEESKFAQTARAGRLAEAYVAHAADDIRVYRDGRLPVAGKVAWLKLVSSLAGRYSWGPVDAVVSSTGDLGFVFGGCDVLSPEESQPFGSSSYLRIWRKTAAGEWRIILDLAVPLPAGSASGQ
jgi:ketosteroid isomerase-like protein